MYRIIVNDTTLAHQLNWGELAFECCSKPNKEVFEALAEWQPNIVLIKLSESFGREIYLAKRVLGKLEYIQLIIVGDDENLQVAQEVLGEKNVVYVEMELSSITDALNKVKINLNLLYQQEKLNDQQHGNIRVVTIRQILSQLERYRKIQGKKYYSILATKRIDNSTCDKELKMMDKLFRNFIEDDLMDKENAIAGVCIIEREAVILLVGDEKEWLRGKCVQVANMIKDQFLQRVAVGVGSVEGEEECMALTYEAAHQVKELKYSENIKGCQEKQKKEQEMMDRTNFSKHDEVRVVSFLKWGRREDLEELLDILFDNKTYMNSVIYMYYMRLHIINLISKFITKMDNRLGVVVGKQELIEACFRTSDVEELKLLYRTIFIGVLDWRDKGKKIMKEITPQ